MSACLGPLQEIEGSRGDLIINRLHALNGQRAGVLNLAIGRRFDHAARPELLLELRVLRIVRMLGLLLGVEVVKIAEKLVKAVVGRQHLVQVAQMILAVLRGHVALVLQQPGDGRVLYGYAFLCPRQADLEQAGTQWTLAGDERRASRRTGLLAIPVGEQRAFLRDAVNVGRLVAHHPAVIATRVVPADVIAPKDEDVGFLIRCLARVPVV